MDVSVKRVPLRDKRQTLSLMYYQVETHFKDLGPLLRLPLLKYFDMVRHIPYIRDRKKKEVVPRPGLNLTFAAGGLDCKKKATLIGAWARGQVPPIPYRFVASSTRPDRKIEHVFPQLFLGGKWRNADATYSHYKLFAPKPKITVAQILRRAAA